MVAQLEAMRAIRSPAVRGAFLAVPREAFVPEIEAGDGLEAVYRPDAALVTATDRRGLPISSSSAPSIMAPMLEALELRPGLSVLEIGAGTGYQAALLQRLVGAEGRVTTLDLEPAFALRAADALRDAGYDCEVVVGDGHLGWLARAPFDRIVVTASADRVPRAWRDQLVDAGLVELPLRLPAVGPLQGVVTFRRDGVSLRSTAVIPGGFMPLRADGRPGTVGPSLRASVATTGRSPLLRYVEGARLANLSGSASRRVLRLLLETPRRVRTVRVTEAGGLILYLTWLGDRGVLSCHIDGRYGVAVVGPGGESLAALTRAPGKAGRLEAWGDERASGRLRTLIEGWERRGRPGLEDLRVTVTYGRTPVPVGGRTVEAGESTLHVDWSPGSSSSPT